MSAIHWLAFAAALGLAGYLIYALLAAEKF
jgi:K+-transporting ATPase KdpF subunit